MLSIPLHPLFVHFPIALLLSGTVAVIVFQLWPKPAGVQWGFYALVAGWLLTIPALITGLIDKSGMAADAEANAVVNAHITGMIGMWVLYGVAIYLYVIWEKKGALQGWRQWVWLGLLILAAVVIILAGHQGGRLVYELGAGAF